ncbi:MAG: hypothetical protein SO170_06020 [Butyribacter sp.]|nr:hypothetical protein [bacterium]MDY3854495.1 hypothetical protein [Butyribacter sp.]
MKTNIIRENSREKKNQVVSFKVTHEMKSRIQDIAKARGQSISAYLTNAALEHDLDKNIIIERTEILEGLNSLKGWHSDDKDTCQLIEKISKKVQGF